VLSTRISWIQPAPPHLALRAALTRFAKVLPRDEQGLLGIALNLPLRRVSRRRSVGHLSCAEQRTLGARQPPRARD
jgi:hypothetical protein